MLRPGEWLDSSGRLRRANGSVVPPSEYAYADEADDEPGAAGAAGAGAGGLPDAGADADGDQPFDGQASPDGGRQPTVGELRQRAGGWLDAYGRYHMPDGSISAELSDGGGAAGYGDDDDDDEED
jgi:hypothetical protein